MASLPSDFCYKIDSYSYRYAPSVVNTVFATGRSRNRIIEEKKAFIYSVSFDFDQDQFNRWESFLYFDLENSSEEFDAPYWNGSGNSSVGTFRFLPDTYSVAENQGEYLVSFDMELVNRSMDVEGEVLSNFILSGQEWQQYGIYGEINNYLDTNYWEKQSPTTPIEWDETNRRWYTLSGGALRNSTNWVDGYRPSKCIITHRQEFPTGNADVSLRLRNDSFTIIGETGLVVSSRESKSYEFDIDFSSGIDIEFVDILDNSGSGNYITNIQFMD